MDLSVFAYICNILVFQIWVKKLCSVLAFRNVCFNIVVRINHDNVASRGAVGRTHTFVRLQTRIRRKMERRISGVSYMCWMDFHDGILSCGVLCARLISFSFVSFFCVFSGYHAEGYHAPSITCLLYTSPSPRDQRGSRMPSSA